MAELNVSQMRAEAGAVARLVRRKAKAEKGRGRPKLEERYVEASADV